ncbi:hypothetical protein QTP86_028028 [Hemibagrus guttatus]|nr:hypothetical protein QTP86_028028 [Hemibagrus guttatus]
MMSLLYIYILWVTACVDAAESLVTVSAPVGSTVILPCKLTEVFTKTSLIQWKINRKDVVFERSSNGASSGSGYEGRVDIPVDELLKGNCSLVLKNVRITDDHLYKTFTMEHVDSTNSTEVKEINRVNLSVYDQISARVGSTAVLPCEWRDLSIQTPHVQWVIDSEIVFERKGKELFPGEGYEGRVDVPEDELLKGNCSLVLKNVTVTDAGIYRSFMLVKDTQEPVLVQKIKLSVDEKPEESKESTRSGKGRELADMMERRKVDILCVQETRWKGSKARSIGAGFKLFYYGVDSKRNGVGVVLKEELVRNVLEVKRVSDRVMSLKLEIEGVMLNVVSGYAPQVGCELEEKERFWSELDEVMESIPTGERVVIGADFNGHVGEGNTGDEEVMGRFGVKERNLEGQMVVDFAKKMDMAVVNTYFQKREEHRVTYKSGGRRTQVDYILCRRGNLKEISDCKVVVGESVARQHRMVVCRMTLMVCKKKRSEIEKKTKWWKLKKEECCEEFRQKLRQALGGQVLLPDDWETTAEVIRETGRRVLGVSSGRRKEDKETWWWNEEVQDSIQRKRLAKKKWDMDRTEENRQEYKELQRRVKREVF